jgi:hypothetical protein
LRLKQQMKDLLTRAPANECNLAARINLHLRQKLLLLEAHSKGVASKSHSAQLEVRKVAEVDWRLLCVFRASRIGSYLYPRKRVESGGKSR